MKKLFTLLTLALLVCSGAWAEELCSAQIENGKTGTFNNTTGESATNCTLYYSGMQGGDNKVTISGIDYYKFGSNDAYVQLKYSGGAFIAGDVVSVMVVSSNGNKSFNLKFGKSKKASSNFSCNASSATAITYTLEASDIEDDGSIKIYRGSSSASNIRANVFSVTGDRKEISTQTFAGVKEGSTTLTETTDYTVAGTVITLTASHKAVSAPTNITLTNHITYTDASTDDVDVPVSFDGTATDGYFVSDATAIGATSYTVKVPVDATPTLTLSAASASKTLKSYDAFETGAVTVTVTGTNLTGSSFTAPSVEGLTITPASVDITAGAFEQEFTITPTATTAANNNVIFAHTGAESQTFTYTYSKAAKRSISQSTVSGYTVWDWSKAPVNDADILLTVIGSDKATVTTDPARGADFLMGTLPEVNNDENFNSQALMINTQYVYRKDGKYFQGSTVSFNSDVTGPARVDVYFSNTSNREDIEANRRYLYINGTNTGVYTLNQTFQVAGLVVDDASTITISAKTGEETPAATMIRISKIVFTPQRQATIAASGYSSLASSVALDFANAVDGSSNKTLKAYVVSDLAADKVTLEEIASAPAGTGVILMGTAGETYTIPTIATPASITTNKLSAAVTTTDVEKNTAYIMSGGKLKLYSGTVIPAGKAYLQASKVPASANELSLDFSEGGATGIQSIENTQIELLKGDFYNLAGQRVAQPTKGLYIVNGKKVIVK